MSDNFDYLTAFSRNIGWVTETEQLTLKQKKVAIAGMGGVGGVHLLTCARMGIGNFHIADFDNFEMANINRQVGAMHRTLGKPKAEVMANMALDVNPEIRLRSFDSGVTNDNIDEFLSQTDLYIDGLDFYVLELRRRLFARCRELNIPAITAAPIGMGTAYLVFLPQKMSFEDYFCLDDLPKLKQQVNFIVGLAPKGFHQVALIDPSKFDFQKKTAPSIFPGCEFSAAAAGVEALKILLNRGKVYAAPYFHQFDCFSGKWKRGYIPGGNRNPIQQMKLALAYRKFLR